MAKQIKVVIGWAFGDEGKGLMTDYFSGQGEAVLNVRFNGGSQAGHTCVLADGRRHVFHHFGAGSFQKQVTTYLTEDFILNPIIFKEEWVALEALGLAPRVLLDEASRVTLPFDMMINQLVEMRRVQKHGSCGLGIHETVWRNRESEFGLTIGEIRGSYAIAQRLQEIREKYVWSRLKDLGIWDLSPEEKGLFENEGILTHYLLDLDFMLAHCEIRPKASLAMYDYYVFEGAQGLLLDRDNGAYYPHVTPSHTGLKNVVKTLNGWPDLTAELEICYVGRSYMTRHGHGPFTSNCSKEKIGANLLDLTNGYNTFQGDLRYGYFDEALCLIAIAGDLEHLQHLIGNYQVKKSLSITHLDETDGKIIYENGTGSGETLKEKLGSDRLYTAYGPSKEDVLVI